MVSYQNSFNKENWHYTTLIKQMSANINQTNTLKKTLKLCNYKP